MLAGGVFATLVGTGQLRLGGEHAAFERSKATLRKVGPLLVLVSALLLASTYLR